MARLKVRYCTEIQDNLHQGNVFVTQSSRGNRTNWEPANGTYEDHERSKQKRGLSRVTSSVCE